MSHDDSGGFDWPVRKANCSKSTQKRQLRRQPEGKHWCNANDSCPSQYFHSLHTEASHFWPDLNPFQSGQTPDSIDHQLLMYLNPILLCKELHPFGMPGKACSTGVGLRTPAADCGASFGWSCCSTTYCEAGACQGCFKSLVCPTGCPKHLQNWETI